MTHNKLNTLKARPAARKGRTSHRNNQRQIAIFEAYLGIDRTEAVNCFLGQTEKLAA